MGRKGNLCKKGKEGDWRGSLTLREREGAWIWVPVWRTSKNSEGAYSCVSREGEVQIRKDVLRTKQRGGGGAKIMSVISTGREEILEKGV